MIRSSRIRVFGSLCVLCVSVVNLSVGMAGCGRAQATKQAAPAAFSPEGRWRSSNPRVGVMTVKLLPDGTLDMMDGHQHHHPFHRIGPDRWEAKITPQLFGSIQREGDQLVFRTRPTPEASKPIGQKNGLMIGVQPKSIEDRMTRVPESTVGKGSQGLGSQGLGSQGLKGLASQGLNPLSTTDKPR